MNKKAVSKTVILIIIVVILLGLVAAYFLKDRLSSSPSLSPAGPISCKDTDGGKNYNVFGRISLNYTSYVNVVDDVCLRGLLYERYCNVSNNYGKSIAYNCSNGRLNGACVISCIDNDRDGYNQTSAGCGIADCNDKNPSIRPGALEICTDSIDNDCDGVVNDGCATNQTNQTLGRIFRVTGIYNFTGIVNDKVTLVDVRTQDTTEATITSDGVGTISIGGRSYTIRYFGSSTIPQEDRYMEIEDSPGFPPEARTGLQRAFRNSYLIIGNPAWSGFIGRVTRIVNVTTGFSSDSVRLTDFRTGDSIDAVITREGEGTITIRGKVHTLRYFGSSLTEPQDRYIEIDFEQRAFRNSYIVFPE